jgi:uncharacterized protein
MTITLTISRRTLSILFAAAFALAALALGFSPLQSKAQTTEPASFEDKAVYHVDDPAMAAHALANIANHLTVSPQAKISLVANGDAVNMLLASSDYAERISHLQAKGVRFVACNNSMRYFKITATSLIPGVVVVPAGVAELSRLQVAEHYAYIKP